MCIFSFQYGEYPWCRILLDFLNAECEATGIISITENESSFLTSSCVCCANCRLQIANADKGFKKSAKVHGMGKYVSRQRLRRAVALLRKKPQIRRVAVVPTMTMTLVGRNTARAWTKK